MSYSLEIKRQLVELVQGGLPIPQAAKQLQVPVSTAYDWINAHNKNPQKFFATKAKPQSSESFVTVEMLEELANIYALKIENEEGLRKFKYRCTKFMNAYPDYAHNMKGIMDTRIAEYRELEALQIEKNTIRFIHSVQQRMANKKPHKKP